MGHPVVAQKNDVMSDAERTNSVPSGAPHGTIHTHSHFVVDKNGKEQVIDCFHFSYCNFGNNFNQFLL